MRTRRGGERARCASNATRQLHTALFTHSRHKRKVAKEAAEAGNDGVMSSIYNIANNALEDIK